MNTHVHPPRRSSPASPRSRWRCPAVAPPTTPAATTPATTAPSTGGESLSGTLNGGGASSQESAQGVWRAGFQGDNPGVTVNYDPVGSGAGRENFISGASPSPAPTRR